MSLDYNLFTHNIRVYFKMESNVNSIIDRQPRQVKSVSELWIYFDSGFDKTEKEEIHLKIRQLISVIL